MMQTHSQTPALAPAAPKTVFITGGASGIGKAMVRKLLAERWNVGMMDIDVPRSEALVAEYLDAPLAYFPGDVRSSSSVYEALEGTCKRFGGLHALFPNAGIHFISSLLKTSEAEFEELMATNLKGTFLTLKHGVPYLLEAGTGAIVLMGSDQSLVGRPDTFAYGASKGAIGQMAKSLAQELGPYGIRVNAVCPGTIHTPLAHRALQKVAELHFQGDWERCLAESTRSYPLGRFGVPEEVAEAVYFLLSDRSSYISGALLSVDGGFTSG